MPIMVHGEDTATIERLRVSNTKKSPVGRTGLYDYQIFTRFPGSRYIPSPALMPNAS